MFLNSLHFGGRRVCQSSEIGLEWIHKWEFKMKSACTTHKRGQLVLVKWKWCNEFNKENLKHKFYTPYNLWEEAPLPSL
jgi:hypothetical protein